MANITVNFEDLATGTIVEKQYQSKGVTFIKLLGAPLPYVNVLEHPGYKKNVLEFRSGVEVAFCEAKIMFDRPHAHIAIDVLNLRDSVANVDVSLLDAAGNTLQSLGAQLDAKVSAGVLLSAGREMADVYGVFIRTPSTHDRVGLAALTFDEPQAAVVPDFALQIGTLDPLSTNLRPGGSLDLPFGIVRVQGSQGTPSFSAKGLPTGVTAAFKPVPGAVDQYHLHLSVAANAPASSFCSIQIEATPPDANCGPAPRSAAFMINIQGAFEISMLPRGLPPCTLVAIPLEIGLPTFLGAAQGNWSGTVSLSVMGALPTGVSAKITPSSVQISPASPKASAVLEIKDDSYQSGELILKVAGSSPPYSSVERELKLPRTGASFASASPTAGSPPHALQPGTEVVVTGEGFCADSAHLLSVQFGNAKAVAKTRDIAPDGRSAKVNVPRLATTGLLKLSGTAGTIDTAQPFTVKTYRNTHGFCFDNWKFPSGPNYGDLTDAFGKDQTWITIKFDPCDGIPIIGWFVDCEIQFSIVPHPLGLIVLGMAQGIDAHCFGMSLTSVRLLKGAIPYSSFPPSGATKTWELTGSKGASPSLARHLYTTSLQQFGAEFMRNYVGNFLLAAVPGIRLAEAVMARQQIIDQLNAGEHPLIALRNGGAGHLVVALDIEDNPAPNVFYYIHIYDPNVCFTPDENTNAAKHEEREQTLSRITVFADGTWQYPGQGGWGPFGFHTFSEGLVVAPYSVTPMRPSFMADPMGFLTFLIGSAECTQVGNLEDRTLLNDAGELNTDPNTRLKAAPVTLVGGSEAEVRGYMIDDDGGFYQQIKGNASGSYRMAVLGKGLSALVEGLPAQTTTRDRLQMDGVKRELSFGTNDSSKTLDTTVIATASDGSWRTMGLRTTTFAGGGEKLQYDTTQDAAVYRHDGQATRASLTLSHMAKDALPSAFEVRDLDVADGEELIFKPKNWRRLDLEEVSLTRVRKDGSTVTAVLKGEGPKIKPTLTLKQAPLQGGIQFSMECRMPQGTHTSSMVFSWAIAHNKKVLARGFKTINEGLEDGVTEHSVVWAPPHPGDFELVVYARGVVVSLPPAVAGVEARLAIPVSPPGQAKGKKKP